MRLSSPFKDYYDGCLGLSEDEGLFWRRVEKQFDSSRNTITGRPAEDVPWALRQLKGMFSSSYGVRDEFRPIYLVVGNRWWTGYRRAVTASRVYDEQTSMWKVPTWNTVWNADKPVEGLSKHQMTYVKSGELMPHQRQWTYELDCPLYLFDLSQYGKNAFMNPCLRAHQVHGFADSMQIAQEIKMWFGNRASKDDTPIKIADKDRIQQHGFDKWSFRKPPADN